MIKPRATATLPAQDIERAKAWYAEKLGLSPVGTDPLGGLLYEGADGTGFSVFPSGGKPSGTHTQLGLELEDFDSGFRDLRARGVRFEEYDVPGLKTVDGVATFGELKGAWFKDSEGNLIGLASRVTIGAART